MKTKTAVAKIGDDLIAQMDAIEETLRSADVGQTTHKAVQCLIDTFPCLENTSTLMTVWYTNVHILLKIKRLKDDNMNGMMYRLVMGKKVIVYV